MVTIVVLQGMISVAVDMLPLPGGMGISESLFYLFCTNLRHTDIAGDGGKQGTQLLHRIDFKRSYDSRSTFYDRKTA